MNALKTALDDIWPASLPEQGRELSTELLAEAAEQLALSFNRDRQAEREDEAFTEGRKHRQAPTNPHD